MLGYFSLSEKDLIPEVGTVWSLFKSELKRSDADIEKDSEGLRYWTEQLSRGVATAAQIAATAEEVAGWLEKLKSGAIANRDQLRTAILNTK